MGIAVLKSHRFAVSILLLGLCVGLTPSQAQQAQPAQPAQVSALEGLSFIKKLKLARAGDDVAQLSVALDYELGQNAARKDAGQAARWYRESALLGNVEAQYRLAKMVSGGAPEVAQDLPAALKLFQSAAERGHLASQNEMGLRLQKGEGTAVNLDQAIVWYQKAADKNYAPSQVNLGLLFVKGEGVKQDHAQAFALFEKAATAGDAWGLNNLGSMYEMGWGTTADKIKAKSYYEQAMAKGNKMGEANLQRLVANTGATTSATE